MDKRKKLTITTEIKKVGKSYLKRVLLLDGEKVIGRSFHIKTLEEHGTRKVEQILYYKIENENGKLPLNPKFAKDKLEFIDVLKSWRKLAKESYDEQVTIKQN